MDERNEDARKQYAVRINTRPSAMDAIRKMAKVERISLSTMIGIAVEGYITSRTS